MKLSILLLICSTVFTPGAHAQDQAEPADSVVVIESYPNLFLYQNFYLSGQPSMEALQWLKYQGVTRIINIRTEGEIEDFTEEAFDEAVWARSLGFDYHNIEVYSSSDYTPEKLNEISELLAQDEVIMLHCRSAGRATNFFMAYLVRSRGYTIDEAIEVGKDLKFSFPLEKILGANIHMEEQDE